VIVQDSQIRRQYNYGTRPVRIAAAMLAAAAKN